jgi:ATP phosphoribosyltransferase
MSVILGLPKGSLQDATFNMMRKAGFNLSVGSRSYIPSCDDPELLCRLIRAQEISRYVELGVLDAGITGYDWIYENHSDVVEVAELLYAKQGLRPVRWVVAVPNDSPIQSVKDLQGRRIATEAVGLTRRYLEKHGVDADVEFSWGATEVKAPELVDAIVELTETGSSLRANNLRIVDTVLTSTTRLICSHKAWADPAKRAKIENLALLLAGALAAETRVLLKMNVPAQALGDVIALLPALHAPTVNSLNAEGWHAVETVVEECRVRELIPALRGAGAQGIIELPINKIIL